MTCACCGLFVLPLLPPKLFQNFCNQISSWQGQAALQAGP